jgi:hypothetical protein
MLVANGAADEWQEPEALPDALPPVPAFDPQLLPVELGPWAEDIAIRMSVPLDFVGVAAMVAAGSVIGRRITIRPEMRTDWTEAANLWGCIVARPGELKSPSVRAALEPVRWLEGQAATANAEAMADYKVETHLQKLAREQAEKGARKALQAGDSAAAKTAMTTVEERPQPRVKRFVTSDATMEKLGEICADNPDGVLVHRDELLNMLSELDREEKASARGMLLTAWSGLDSYTFDRIGRGTIRIPAVNVSLFGTTQPARLAGYLREALRNHDDGMVQRLQLLVWPDPVAEWRQADRPADTAARERAFRCFDRLSRLEPQDVDAEVEPFRDAPAYLRLGVAAYGLFGEWRADLERRVRGGDLSPAFASHLAKYRGLVPRLALVHHLASGGTGPVSEKAMLRALDWAGYLEGHAGRVYAGLGADDVAAARAIWNRIAKGQLEDGFTDRDVYRPKWSGLTDPERVKEGLAVLSEYQWIRAQQIETGGRAKTVWRINPQAGA